MRQPCFMPRRAGCVGLLLAWGGLLAGPALGQQQQCPQPPPGVPLVTIPDVQGSNGNNGTPERSPREGQVVAVEGIVTGDFQTGDNPDGNGDLDGFFLEVPERDPISNESNGIFIAEGGDITQNPVLIDVAIGDEVQVVGTVFERELTNPPDPTDVPSRTEVRTLTRVEVCSQGNDLPPPEVVGGPDPDLTITIPFQRIFSAVESERVAFGEPLFVTATGGLFERGEFVATIGTAQIFGLEPPGPLVAPTDLFAPTDPDAATAGQLNTDNVFVIDDGVEVVFPEHVPYPSPELTAFNSLRRGDEVTGLVGIVDFNQSAESFVRLQPTETPIIAPTGASGRPPVPDLRASEANLRVATFNVLNYFTSLDNPDPQSDTDCAPPRAPLDADGNAQDCQGANTDAELERQTQKLVEAILALDAEIVGLVEVQNDYGAPDGSTLERLVESVNAQAPVGTVYDFIDPMQAVLRADGSGDATAVGIIYQPVLVRPIGNAEVLNAEDAGERPQFEFNDQENQPVLVQTFALNENNAQLTVAVAQLASRDPQLCDLDEDPLQGACNQVRVEAAQFLAEALVDAPTGFSDPDVVVLGTLNAFAAEEPITAFGAAGFTNLVARDMGVNGDPMGYTFVLEGQQGSLDYALATGTLVSQVVDVTTWHINADEPPALDYNVEHKTADLQSKLFNVDPFRSSDHDPVVVALRLNNAPTARDGEVETVEDVPLFINLEPLVLDADGDAVALVEFDVNFGTVTQRGPLQIDYIPPPEFGGAVTIEYVIEDELGARAEGRVRVVVRPVNDPPIAVADAVQTDAGEAVVIDVLANDDDVELGREGLMIVAVSGVIDDGVAEINDEGTVTFTPPEDFAGQTTFTYTVSDGIVEASAPVTVTVLESNRPPVAVTDSESVSPGLTAEIDVLANDEDPDGDSLSVLQFFIDNVEGAQVSPDNPNVVLYTPPSGFTGFETFEYVVSDGSLTATGVVNITVGTGGGGEPVVIVEGGGDDNGAIAPLGLLGLLGLLLMGGRRRARASAGE